jgi:hypothetical protein
MAKADSALDMKVVAMVTKKQPKQKRYFTAAEANAMLPLVRAIVADVAALARDLRDRHERLAHIPPARPNARTDAHQEELRLVESEMERGQERMRDYEKELRQLGVELKDYFTGLVDFPCLMHGREVYLCWRLGESEVAHWHELEDGFAGRQKLLADAARS